LPSRFTHPVEVFRSARQRACHERAFVLDAVGIDNEIELDGDAYALRVDAVASAHARHHLFQYEQESRAPRPVEPEMQVQPRAWLGSLVYAVLLFAVSLAVSDGWPRFDLQRLGVMDPALIRAGEWWRCWTALTLHWDATHLLGNLIAGGLLGHSAAQIWGNGRAWLLIVVAAAAANLVEASLAAESYVSAGASTAVFATLGLVAAWSWRTRRRYAHNWMRRLVPLIAGIAVLAMLGAGDGMEAEVSNHTNVLSHALGFSAGAITGIAVATQQGGKWVGKIPEWMATGLTIGQLMLAWSLAVMQAS
jgi:MYXO-CTERM domain-containing protein